MSFLSTSYRFSGLAASSGRFKKIVGGLPEGQKRSVAYRAARLIESGEIDSRKTIAALEEVLGIDLVEK